MVLPLVNRSTSRGPRFDVRRSLTAKSCPPAPGTARSRPQRELRTTRCRPGRPRAGRRPGPRREVQHRSYFCSSRWRTPLRVVESAGPPLPVGDRWATGRSTHRARPAECPGAIRSRSAAVIARTFRVGVAEFPRPWRRWRCRVGLVAGSSRWRRPHRTSRPECRPRRHRSVRASAWRCSCSGCCGE